MFRIISVILMITLILTGCDRGQKNANTVTEQEVPSDFTTQPQAPQSNDTTTPMLPGKAQILGAPFNDVQTQTGTATVLPSQDQTVAAPQTTPQPAQ